MATTTTTLPAVSGPRAARTTARTGRPSRPRGGMTKKKGVDWLLLAFAVAAAALIVAPFYLILVNSFKSPADYSNGGPLALPTGIYLDGIIAFWERVDFPGKVWNSFFISGMVAILACADLAC